MKLSHADSCPYCVRTRLVLAAKGVEHESVQVDLSNKPAWLRELNPRNRVPVIEHDGHVLIESEALGEYLDEVYPQPRMMPADPAGRARVRALMRRFEDLSDAYYAARRGDEGALGDLYGELGWVEQLLTEHAYLAGDEYTLAEPGYWPWIVRVDRVGGTLDGFPAIRRWLERLDARPEYRVEHEMLGLGATPGSRAAR
jgi:glutathione S-transferase